MWCEDAGCKMQDARCRMQDAGCRMQGPNNNRNKYKGRLMKNQKQGPDPSGPCACLF